MRPDLLRVLLAADDTEGCESPPGFERAREIARVKQLRPAVERIVGRPFAVDENVQDASFFTDLAACEREPRPEGGTDVHTILAVRFSAFGRFFTVWSVCPEPMKVDPATVARVIRAVSEQEYVYLEAEGLDEPYTGPNPHLKGTSWWIRYFDYL